MNRAQLSAHRRIWRLLGPVLLITIFVSLSVRPKDHVVENETLPAFLNEKTD